MKKKHKFVGSGGDGDLSCMVSAMIPGAKVDNKGRIMVNVATSKETVHFNIGGAIFETYRSTLFRLPNSPLANDKFLKEHYRQEKNDYFFDRDPDIFRATLNYLRTGELHIPSYICGPAAKTELEYWGVLPRKIERCCWTNYNDWNSTLCALNTLEQDRKGYTFKTDQNSNSNKTVWSTYQPLLWNFFDNPNTSVYARIYGFVSLLFVFVSIFSFVASTTSECSRYVNVTGLEDVSQIDFEFYDGTSDSTAFDNPDKFPGQLFVKLVHPALHIIDLVCLVFFTVEYVSRVIFSPGTLRFVTSSMGVIDLLAILPDYIDIVVYSARPDLHNDMDAMEYMTIIRILRVLRIFRLIKHVPGLWILVYTLKASVNELVLLTCFMSVGILLFSSTIYFVEERDNFPSIPHAFWWALITMTTVGYGDIYPTTTLGKLVGSLCAMSGLLMIGFSVPSLVNNFMLYYKHMQFALQAEKEGNDEDTQHPHGKHETHYESGVKVESDTDLHPKTDKNSNDHETQENNMVRITESIADTNGQSFTLDTNLNQTGDVSLVPGQSDDSTHPITDSIRI